MNLGIEGRVSLVTGPGRGIGRGIALELAKEGARLILLGRTLATLESLCEQLPGGHTRHWCVGADLMTADIEELAGQIRTQCGAPAIIVHNLGGSLGVSAPLAPADDWNRVWRFNLGIAAEFNRQFIPAMTSRKWGRIVHISSTSGSTSHGYPAYAVAKAALNAYVKSVGRAVAPDNVVISAVAPGAIELEGRHFAQLKQTDPAALAEYFRHHVAAGRLGQVDEIAPAVAFLCSELASFAAGTVMGLDGGAS